MSQASTLAPTFFKAMQAGSAGAEALMALFHDDASYCEPFSGTATWHNGKKAIHDAMAQGWAHPLPDMTIEIDKLLIDGDLVIADWTCRSPGLPGGFGKGSNEFHVRDGKITRLITTLKGMDSK